MSPAFLNPEFKVGFFFLPTFEFIVEVVDLVLTLSMAVAVCLILLQVQALNFKTTNRSNKAAALAYSFQQTLLPQA